MFSSPYFCLEQIFSESLESLVSNHPEILVTDHDIHSPEVDWEKVTCPKALTDITGCVRSGETPTSVKSLRPLHSHFLTSLTFSPSDDAAPASKQASPAAASSSATSSTVESSSSSVVASSSSATSSVQASSTDAYVASSATGETAYPTDQSPAADAEPSNTPSSNDSDEEECEVQYVYEN
jgi:hypothetical protein